MATVIEATECLFVPHRKRLLHSYGVNHEGAQELRIYYGDKEIVFDDERYFAFGEQLASGASFTGERAMTWGPGYTWDELRPFVESLVDEEILQRGEHGGGDRHAGLVASQLSPAVCAAPRSWSAADCEAITRELAGWAAEVGYLEVLVPVYRVAHAALDADGRQVGEANVYPPGLRLQLETEWRMCQYAGSRYRDHMPMNITALKAMIKYWKPMMVTLMAVRGALRDRLGPVPAQAPEPALWTIGELYLLSCVVLALPAYQLAKRGGSSPQPALHPVLSSLFRITDGIRMTTSHMLFSIEHTCAADEQVRGTEIHDRAEQQGLLLNTGGVCAGPKHLIDEFLRTAIDGEPPEGIDGIGGIDRPALPDEVSALLAELPAVIDYGLYGLQIWGASFAVWLAMSRAYEELLAIFLPAAGAGPTCAALCERLQADWAMLARQQVTLAYDRHVHLTFYADAYERSRGGTRVAVGRPALVDEIAPVPDGAMHRAAAAQLRAQLDARLTPAECAAIGDVARCSEAVVGYLREVQSILASCERLAAAINRLIERPQPRSRLRSRDLYTYYAMYGDQRPVPYLPALLAEVLGISLDCTASEIDLADLREPARTSTAAAG